jgi:hypothetical protein
MAWASGDTITSARLNYRGGNDINVKDTIYGAAGDGSTDDTSAFTTAVSAATDGDVIRIPSSASFYKLTGTIDVDRAIKWVSDGGEVRFTTSSTTGFNVSVGSVAFDGLRIVGPQNTVSRSKERAVHFSGSTAVPLVNAKVRNCHIRNWGYMGISGEYTNKFDFSNNLIEEINYGGIHLFSCQEGVVGNNSIDSITGSSTPKYGITVARGNADTVVEKPRSKNVTVVGNTVTRNDAWHGIDVHGGENVAVVGNSVCSCFDGVSVGVASSSTDLEIFGPLNVTVVGNTLDSGVADGTYRYGVSFNGANGEEATGTIIEAATGCIVGNIVKNYGDEDSSLLGAVSVKVTQGLVISGNHIENPGSRGISLLNDNYDFICSDNVIQDPWTDTLAEAVGIKVDDDYQDGYIGENITCLAGKSANTNMDKGIRIDNNSNLTIRVGQNISQAADPFRDDSGGAEAVIPATIKTEGTFLTTSTARPLSFSSAANFNDMAEDDFRLVFAASGVSFGWSSGDSLYMVNSAQSEAQPTS